MITLYLFIGLLLFFVSGLYSNIVKKPALYEIFNVNFNIIEDICIEQIIH